MISLAQAFAFLVTIVPGVVWLVRLEGRINVTDSRYAEIIRRLERIEKKQDAEDN